MMQGAVAVLRDLLGRAEQVPSDEGARCRLHSLATRRTVDNDRMAHRQSFLILNVCVLFPRHLG